MGTLQRTIVCCLAVLLSAGLIGCVDAMARPSEIEGFRVLAVQAEPPEIAPGAGTTLTALWTDPTGKGREVTFLWVALKGAIHPAAGFAGGEPLALPQLKNAKDGGDVYEIPATPTDIIEQLALQGETSVALTVLTVACAGGTLPSVDELARLESIDDPAALCRGGDGIAIKKTVKVSSSDTPNTNPVLDALLQGGQNLPADVAQSAIPACRPGIECKDIELGARFTKASLETFPASEKVDGATGTDEEILYVSWFTTAGELKSDRSAPKKPGEAAENTLTLAADDGNTASLFVVARDNRGGTSWRTLTLTR